MSELSPTNGSRNDIPMRMVESEQLSPQEFLNIAEEEPTRIKSSNFVPPKLGENHFGYVRIEYRKPVFKRIEYL